MWSSCIVETFYVREDRLVELLIGAKVPSVGFFFLEIFEETFATSIIKSIFFYQGSLGFAIVIKINERAFEFFIITSTLFLLLKRTIIVLKVILGGVYEL